MFVFLRYSLLLSSTFLFLIAANSQGYLKTNGKQIVDGDGKEILLRGIGLGGWMLQEPYMLQLSGVAGTQGEIRSKIRELIGEEKTKLLYNAWLANHCQKKDIDSLAAWGFNSVRLPMHYNLFTLPVEEEPIKGKNTWLQKGFELTDSLLSWCKANKLYLILDLHAAPGGQGNDNAISDRDPSKPSLWQSEEAQQKTVALWQKLAERYANEPWIGAYDLINEPNWGFVDSTEKNGLKEPKNEPLRNLLVQITNAIRAVDTNHIIIIEGNGWGNNYNGIFPLWDSNMVVSFHKYWNYNDHAAIQHFIRLREQYNVPIWMGESGENSNTWFRSAIELLERNKIGWAWWPLKKLGFNNPLQIKAPEGYQQLINYWKGSGVKPSTDKAFMTLMELAENTRLEKNSYHIDVIDAMFRQVWDTATIPFRSNIIKNNAILYAVDYDLGRNGFAYYDTDTANFRVATGKNTEWNRGKTYRNDGVDIEPCTDAPGNGYCVGSIEKREWLQYTVQVLKEGRYDLTVRIKSSEGKGSIQLFVDGKPVTQSVVFRIKGKQKGWTSVKLGSVALKAGTHTLRVQAEEGGFLLNYLQFSKTKGK